MSLFWFDIEKYATDKEIPKIEDIDLSNTYTYADYLKWTFDERL